MTGPESATILDRSVPRGLTRAAGVLMDALRIHAMVLAGGVVHDNPYGTEGSSGGHPGP
jgi:hypothetical protein